MSARRFKGYRVGIIKPDGARRYMKPRSDGKWSLSEAKPTLLDEDEMSDALDEVGDFMAGGDVSFSTPVFAVRKPKPVVVPPLAQALAILSLDEPKPAPVVAAEGLFALLLEDSGDAHFTDINDGTAGHKRDAQRDVGTREQAVTHHAKWGGRIMRVLEAGEHEAAVAEARREERERCLRVLDWSYGNVFGISGDEREAKRRAHMADPTFNVREPGLHAHDCPECRAVWECFESTCPQTNDVSKQGLWMSDDMICEECESKVPDEDEAAKGQAK